MIVWDTETTGLPGVSLLELTKQPEIIEFGAIKLNDETFEEVGAIHFLCRPRILPLDPVIVKITGIRTEDLVDKPPFVSFLPQVIDFFLGEQTMVAHNLPFDRQLLYFELRRLGLEWNFPWPYHHRCTAELTQDIKGKPMKHEDLYEHYIGHSANQTHRALDDVRQLCDIVRCMRREGRI